MKDRMEDCLPCDPGGACGKFGGFREEYPGGALHAFRYLVDQFLLSDTRRAAHRASYRQRRR